MKAIDFLSAEDFLNEGEQESPFAKTNKKLKGYGEAALSMLAPLPSQIAGGLYGLNSLLTGQGIDKAGNDVAKVQDWNFGFGAYKPTTEEGQQSAESLANMFAYPGEKAGDVGAWVGKKLGNEELGRLTAKLPVDVAMNWLPIHGIVKAPIKAAEGINALRNKTPAPVSDMAAKIDALKTKVSAEAFLDESPAIQQMTDQLTEGATSPYRPDVLPEVKSQNAMNQVAEQLTNEGSYQRSAKAQQELDLRQQAMEQEVARQTSLDQNAAQRARQENAPTGYEQWREGQQQAAEQRMPGDNTPLNMESPYPVDVNQFPQVLKDAPYKHEGGLDFTQEAAGNAARPLEQRMQRSVEEQAAWDQRNQERAVEQAYQEKRQSALEDPSLVGMEDTLRAEQYRPQGDGQGPKTRAANAARLNKFGQGGAIRPEVFEDLYKFGKSVVRGVDGLLAPVYHGTIKDINGPFKTLKGFSEYSQDKGGIDSNGWINAPKRSYPGDLGAWFSSTPSGTDTFAGARTGATGGNVHQVYLNLENPKVFQTHGDFIDWFHSQTDKGQSANYARRQLVKQGYDGIQIKESTTDAGGMRQDFVAFHPEQAKSAISGDAPRGGRGLRSQRGAIDPDLMTLGIPKLVSGIKRLVTKTPVQDTLLTPTTQANIEAKALKRAKSNAIGYKNSAYDQITTKEEALANLGKDLSGVTQELGAGIGGAVRRNSTNGALKYTRYNLDQATNGMNAYIKQYVTGKDGFNDTYSKLSTQDKVDAFKLKKKLSEDQMDYTSELGEQLGLTEPLKQHMESRKAAYDAMEAEWGKMNLEKGLETFEHRAGYLASIFDRNFQALVGKTMPDGSFKMDVMVATKSRREFNQALKMYPDATVIKLGSNGRTGLRQNSGKFQVADDMAFLLARMAEHDPRFAEVKQELATAHAIRDKGYKNFDVHEMEKKGVKGFLGDKPWESEATNMKDALEAEIRYFDQAAKYVHGQRLLDKTHEIVTEIKDKQPNAAKFLNKYLDHLTGQNLDPIAGGINKIVDLATFIAGHAANTVRVRLPENPSGALRGVGTAMNALMMNIYSPAMFATQMSQLYISGIPEAVKIRADYGLDPAFVGTSMARAHYYRSIIPALDKMGLLEKTNPPAHIVEAWDWIKKHGMDDFNEVMLSQDILQSKAMSATKQAAFWPTVLPEKFTRPTMFMWMTDMFHEAGYRGQDMLNRAKAATDYSMTDYRQEEAPLIYDKMGVLTPETSALQKYKHNALDQVSSRTLEAKQNPAAFLSALGLSIAFGGLLGLPAMQEIDELIIKKATDKSAREHLEGVLGKGGVLADGAASAYTQLDMGSRFALSDVAPNSAGEAIAGARLSKAYKMVSAAYDYGKNLDEASLIALGKEIVPSGASQAYQEQFMTDKEGHLLNKKGQVQYEHTRDKDRLNRNSLSGVRPLAEKQESERVWAASQRMIKLEEQLAAATERMKIANNIKDKAGFDKALKLYEEKEGNMKALGGMLKQSTIEAAKTEKERRQGKPGKTPMSIKKFLEYEDK